MKNYVDGHVYYYNYYYYTPEHFGSNNKLDHVISQSQFSFLFN